MEGVEALHRGEALANDDIGFCALLTTGEVNCWGINGYGALGNGTFSNSATPVPVEGVAGTGTLTGVESLIGGWNTYCAIFASGGVDCWGFGGEGGLGNGTVSNSATPVPVEGVGGARTLTGVASLTSATIGTYCALLTSGAVDCWGWAKTANSATARSTQRVLMAPPRRSKWKVWRTPPG